MTIDTSLGQARLLRWKPLHNILSIASLAAGDTSADGDRLDLRKKIALALTCEATFPADSVGDLVVHVITCPDDDDYAGEYDTQEFTQMAMQVNVPGEVVQKTITINAPVRFLKVYVENQDQDYPVNNIEVWAAPLGAEEIPGEEKVQFNWS